jgi:putative transcriptional regulator
MSLAKLGVLAVLAAMVAHAPQAANNFGGANWAEASYAKGTILPGIFLPARLFPVQLLPVQSKNPERLGVGKVLVASRSLRDPQFVQTVILLTQYDAGGVVGLILNHRTDVPLSTVLEDYKAAKNRSDSVYIGGPVDPQTILALRKSPGKSDGATRICDGVYQIATKAQLEQALSDRTAFDAFHVYLGYAGWHADQLRKEMELGAWFVFPGDAATVFNSDPDTLWPRMIRKTELEMARSESANDY